MAEQKIETPKPSSPRWNNTTKLVVALTFVAILAGLLIRFRQIIGPLIIAFVLAYLLYPLASFLHRRVKLSWRLAATLVFLILLLAFLGLLTWGGFAVVEQVQSLITFLQVQIRNLPQLIANLTSKPLEWGPFYFDFATLDLTSLTNQLLGMVQPLLSNTASILGSIATGTFTTIGWALFSMLVGYFILSDSGGERSAFVRLQVPGSNEDIRRIRVELSRIWNAFLRGQIIIFTITVLLYILLLGALGVNFYFGLAFIAGLARFVPYVGPAVAWITYGLVALLQGSTIFGLQPFPYALVVVGVAWLTDVIMDNFVVPRMMGDTLKVHPAAVMVAAIVFASLFGIIGVVLAAPVLATAKLILNYATRKMFDQDPWEGMEIWTDRQAIMPFHRLRQFVFWLYCRIKKFWAWLKKIFQVMFPRLKQAYQKTAKSSRNEPAANPIQPQLSNTGGVSDDRSDGTENRYDC